MNPITKILLCLCLWFSITKVNAQWKTQTLTLREGYNNVYLWVDPSPEEIPLLFASYPNITEVWQWRRALSTVTLTTSDPTEPIIKSDWLVWY